VLIVDFAASAITYKIRVWSTDFAADERLRDRIRSAVYYAFKRAGISIPYPIQVEIPGDAAVPSGLDHESAQAVLRRVTLFAALDTHALAALARAARTVTYASGEVIVRQGQPGSSMFVIVRGGAVVILEPGGQEIARLGDDAFFGEMSLLTGAPRTATVRTVDDSDLLEITAETFRTFVLATPAAVEQIGSAVARRAAELEEMRAAGTATATPESTDSLIGRVRKFLQI
jgi:CRP-like cAMP-binding protein